MGGLGNQMFQYALGRRLSLLRKTEVKVNVSFLNDKSLNHTLRKLELDVFAGDIPIATQTELDKFLTIQQSKSKKYIRHMLPFVFPYYSITESTHEYNKEILNSAKNSLLTGYWQTEKYFLPIQDTIKKDFTFKKPLEGLNKAHAIEMAKSNSVSMHIRRGDYIHKPETRQFHGNCTPEYYAAALQSIKAKVGDVHLYIFSDDIAWVKSNMQFDVPANYIENNTGEDSYIDMQLMSLCKHNIIANSSFSWWGAWLNNNPGKIVVAPARWFNDNSVNIKDVIPETWHKL